MSILKSIENAPAVVKAKRQFEALPTRDQKALQVLAVAVVLALLFFFVWSPAQSFMKREKAALSSSKELLQWVRENETVARSLVSQRQQEPSKTLDSQSLVSTVSSNAQKHQIILKRFEPSGDRKVRVWLEKVPFNSVIVWLKDLQSTFNIEVSQVTIDRDEKGGLVNVRLTLKI